VKQIAGSDDAHQAGEPAEPEIEPITETHTLEITP
jgi:hypothetical protein